MRKPKYVISSFCASGECVAVARQADGAVFVKHSSDATRVPVKFSRAEWRAFVQGVKAGEFDV